MCTLHEDRHIRLIVSRSVLLIIRNISHKYCREIENTHFVFNKFFPKIVPLWDNVAKHVEPERPQITIWRMRIACWIPTATNTHSGYIILTAFPLQQWLHERASALIYTKVGTLIVATIYLQLIQNRYMFRSFTVLQCSHQHCVQPVASDVEVVGFL